MPLGRMVPSGRGRPVAPLIGAADPRPATVPDSNQSQTKVSLAVGAGGTRPNKPARPAPRHGAPPLFPLVAALRAEPRPNQTTCWFPTHGTAWHGGGMAVARRGRRAGIKVQGVVWFGRLALCSRHPFPAVASVQRSQGGRGRGQGNKRAVASGDQPPNQPSSGGRASLQEERPWLVSSR